MTTPIRIVLGLVLLSSVAAAQQYVISTFAGGGAPETPTGALDAAIGTPFGVATDAAGNVYFASSNLNSVFKLSRSGMFARVAGDSRPGYSGDGGLATSARMSAPKGVAVDGVGNLFIADTGNYRIRRVSPNGVITTVAGTGVCCFSGDGGPAINAQLSVAAIAADSAGNLFIGGAYRVRKISLAGIITTVAGTGVCCFSGDGGPAVNAALVAVGVAVDNSGNQFIADSIHVRKVSPDGIITTVAGNYTGSSGDGGPATDAQLRAWGVAVDGAGTLFIANVCSIRKVTTSGIITTVAGTCLGGGVTGDGGPATSAQLSGVFGVAVDSVGNLFIADASDGRIRRVSASAIITTVAGNGTTGSSASASSDGGPATSAQLEYPSSVAADSAGNVFITDTGNNRIRRVSPSGIITTVAGNGTQGFSGDGAPAIKAQLRDATALALDGSGNLFFADSAGTRVRKVSANGIITTVAGNGIQGLPRGLPIVDGGPATSTALSGYVPALTVDKTGNLFIADNELVWKVSPAGIIHLLAGGGSDFGDGGPATQAQLEPQGLVADGNGNLFIASGRIRKVSPAGIITTVAGSGVSPAPSGDRGPATNARLSYPAGLALDSAGNLFIADPGAEFLTGGEIGPQPCCDHRVRKISPDGMIATVAGIGTPGFSGDGGPASTAALNGPLSVAVDGVGNVYVADSYNGEVRVLRPTGRSLLIGAVVDAANPSAGPVSPGKIVTIYGAGLGPLTPVQNQASGGTFGTKLSGTTVAFNGIAAPILYTSANQIAAIVPYAITGPAAHVIVTYQGQDSNDFTVAVGVSAPSIFTMNQEGWGQAAAINAVDGTVNTAANPVRAGDYVSLYATGEGQTSPLGVDGSLGGSTPIRPVLSVSVTVGGLPATYQYAGSATGQVAGLMQVNVKIPDGVQLGGYVPVVVQLGNASTSDAVWIAVARK